MFDEMSKWYDECESGALLFVRGRLQLYRPLALFREQLAATGVARAREVVRYLQRNELQVEPGRLRYFASQGTLDRWLKTASYRETLRLVLDLEPIEAILVNLPVEDRFTLRAYPVNPAQR